MLFLAPYLARGGTERHLIDLTETIRWKESPWVIAPDGPSRPALEQAGARWLEVPLLAIGGKTLSRWRDAFSEAVRELDPHLIHVHAGVELLWVTRRLAGDRPRVFTVHGYHGGGADLSYHLAGLLGGRLATRVIAVSRSEAERLSGVPRVRLRVVLNGVADTRQSQAPPRPEGIPKDAVVVAVASRLERPKGVDLVVQAFVESLSKGARVVSRGGRPAEAHLLVLGTGSQEATLRRTVADAGFEHRIHLLGYQPDAAAYYQHADLLVQVSRQDALPLTVAEAMAAGLPAVVSDAGGLPELVEDGVTGRVVPAGQVAPLVDTFAALLEDPEGREAMGWQARCRYETLFTLDRFAAETLAVYRELADGVRDVSNGGGDS